MNAEERSLITGLFDRMWKFSGIEKDDSAAKLINDEVRRNPDAPYLLAQSVLVQEQALQQAESRIRDLEKDVVKAQAAATEASVRSSAASPSFMGGSRSASVPPAGASRNYPGDRSSAGGSFMAQALSTAAGVAGGMLLASGISSLISGDSASASQPAADASGSSGSNPAANENAGSGNQEQDASAIDAADEHGADDGSWGDWGDFGGDLDI